MRRYLFLILFACATAVHAQSNTGAYKYIVVPEKFSFLKQPNQYNLNVLTKALFEDQGFSVYFDNTDIPTEIAADRCKALMVEVQENNSMFVTNLTILLKDCKGTVVAKSKEGKSREKEYKSAFNYALRDAFTSLNDFRYQAGQTQQSNSTATVAAKPVTSTPTNTVTPPAQQATTPEVKQSETLLYAQPINNGYQLIDAAPKIVLTLLKTSADDYFIANNGNTNGIVLKKNGTWFFEYYKDNKLVAEKLAIKF